MSYQDDNNLQALPAKLYAEYIKKAAQKLDADFKKIRQFAAENNICVPIINPRGDRDYEQTVYYLAEKRWTADGYYDPPTTFTRIKERESKFAKEIL